MALWLGARAGYQISAGLGAAGVTISAANNKIDLEDDGGAATATIAAATYDTGANLATAVGTALNAIGSQNYTCTYGAGTKKLTLTNTDGPTFSLLWLTGPSHATSASAALGFNDADKTGALNYTSDNALPF